jgi:hypothetical protein
VTSLKFFLAGLATGALILVTQTSYGHRLAGHPRSLRGKLELAKRQVIHDQQQISARHGWRLLSLTALSHGWWLGRDVAYRDLLQRMVQPAIGPAWLVSAFMCIHRGEGSWTDSVDPYWGGLQMDRQFMATYGSDMVRRYGGWANVWPPSAQIAVAIRAYRSRGFFPWPTTARRCGLI